jgi:hypothetical protein
VRQFDPTGNFSGAVLGEQARMHNYGTYRLSMEEIGQCGHARALVEMLCLVSNERVCGAVWRLGGAIGADAATGHWVGASHIPSVDNWRLHKWAYKDSLSSTAQTMTTEQILNRLDKAETNRADFFVVVDLL